jgi:Arylsulfotransferase (ASST)
VEGSVGSDPTILGLMGVLAAMLVCAIPFTGCTAAAPQVSAFPIPGTQTALPGSQIVLRGVAPTRIGTITVSGSRSGQHSGHIAADSDGEGASFLPDHPFAPGETVTVNTHLNVIGGSDGTFQFTVARPTGLIGAKPLRRSARSRKAALHFFSRPDLRPTAVTILKRAAPDRGDLFVAPQFGAYQNGPMLLDGFGNLVWFDRVPRDMIATDFRKQWLWGQPVLTWWQGTVNNGSGRGVDVITDRHYRQIATVRAGNGLQGADLHEFLLTSQGQAFITSVSPVRWPKVRKPVMDSVVQEIDIKTGLVLFEWHALDHVPFSESYKSYKTGGYVYDPYHVNSIVLDRDGNLIVSLRNTYAAYKIDHRDGHIIWRLGGKRSSFKMGPGTVTAFQHDVVLQPDGTFTIFDNGAGPPRVHRQSRVIRVKVDTKEMRATLLAQYEHVPAVSSLWEGSAQVLRGGEMLVGWGEAPYVSEFNAHGQIDFDARFNTGIDSYRAYRYSWSGQPTTPPAIAVRAGKSATTVYASWNGATAVTAWRVLAGASSGAMHAVGRYLKHGFETPIAVQGRQRYYEVLALDAAGRVLGRSPLARP